MSKTFLRHVLTKEHLNIQGLELFGYSRTTKAHPPMSLHTHSNCIEMVFLLKGTETYYINDTKHAISRGEIFVSYPNQLHDTGPHPQGVSEFIWLQLNLSEVDGFLGLQNQYSELLLDRLSTLNTHILSVDKESLVLLQKSFNAFKENTFDHKMYGLGLLVSLLFKLTSLPTNPESPNFTISRLLAYIDEHITEPITLEQLCTVGKLSLSTLQHQFKDSVGQSPRDYINSRKIQYSKKLLKQNISITEVAMLLSFSSSDYFSTTFKKYTTQTPSEYISSLQ